MTKCNYNNYEGENSNPKKIGHKRTRGDIKEAIEELDSHPLSDLAKLLVHYLRANVDDLVELYVD